MQNLPLSHWLYLAYNSRFGIIIRTDNIELTKAKLYAERKKDPDLACISITTSRDNPTTELLLVKKNES